MLKWKYKERLIMLVQRTRTATKAHAIKKDILRFAQDFLSGRVADKFLVTKAINDGLLYTYNLLSNSEKIRFRLQFSGLVFKSALNNDNLQLLVKQLIYINNILDEKILDDQDWV